MCHTAININESIKYFSETDIDINVNIYQYQYQSRISAIFLVIDS